MTRFFNYRVINFLFIHLNFRIMKKMRNGMYLFAAAIVAGTMGLTSCSNDEEVVGGNGSELTGATTDVTLSLSVKGASKRLTADQANQGTVISAIKNIWVVPMIGETYYTPISMPDYDENASTLLKKKVTLNEKVNQFKVYGNVKDGFASESAFFTGATFELAKIADNSTKYAPHALYYYGLAGKGTNALKGYTDDNFTQGEVPIPVGNAIGDNYKSIKISGVNYAVGLLAVGVQNGDNGLKFYPTKEEDGTLSGTPVAAGKGVIEVKGVIIDGQFSKLDADFNKATDATEVSVYESAENADFVTTSLAFVNSKVAGANIYSAVSYTEANKDVAMNIVFTLQPGHFITGKDDLVLGDANNPVDVYLGVVLSYEKATQGIGHENYTVFMKDYTTLLNATVKNWSNLSGEEVIAADVNLGVEIDTDWNQGVVYNEEI